ncbi:hypothetical protein LPJ64_005069 [Coemansia asiatica]|uniref:Ion transport domain-containing protein n=1 Tax=Coemansia asiatica TaxID=1052880 RepID=A0A9W8CHZ6_9FUNG|nr:hypothetical protein LPJ64_005069 [Coemansia asiatica]
MHQSFLTSWWNYFDILIVMFCGITLILLSRDCSSGSNSEELVNTVMLVIRNAAQVFRLMATLRKNRRQMAAQDVNVSLDDGAAVLGFIEDMDGLDDDGEGEYHVPGFQNQGSRGGSGDFRLSIDSVGDELVEHAPGIDRADSRSSATSLRSTPDRLTGRKRGNGSG